MTDRQVELAEERTHAAWIRTCLTFLVAALAYHHYGESPILTFSLVILAAAAAIRSFMLAPDIPAHLSAVGLVLVSLASLTVTL